MLSRGNKDLPDLVRQYLFYILTVKNRSKRTAEAYEIDLRNFFRFYKLNRGLVDENLEFFNIAISDITLEDIKNIKILDVYEYLNFSMNSNNNSAKARARKASSIRGFFKYITVNLKVLKENPVEFLELPTVKRAIPKYLSLDESKRLLEKKSEVESSTKYRDYCMLVLFLNCGMRVSELFNISFEDLKLSEGSLKILGKGNKERVVFLNDACISAIKEYIKNERSRLKRVVDESALFLTSKTGRRLGVRQIQKVVERALSDAGLYGMGYSTHKLRHTAATLLYQYGNVDILVLKELLGHANVGTTEIYTHISNKMVKDAVFKNPLANEKMKN